MTRSHNTTQETRHAGAISALVAADSPALCSARAGDEDGGTSR